MPDDKSWAGLQEDLIAVGRGDRGSFRRVYDATAPKLFAICLRIVGDRAVAEEVLQDIYLKVWQSAAAYDPTRARPMTWLGTIARNKAIDRYRSRMLRPRSTTNDANLIVDEAELTDHRMIREEAERLAFTLVSELKGEEEIEIHKIFFDGLTFTELAEEENRPLGTVKSRVRRLILKLRQKLEDE